MIKQLKLYKSFLIHLRIDIKIIWNQWKVVSLLYYKCHKINGNGSGSYVGSPDWIKNKKATKNPINKTDGKCFPSSLTVALNNEEIRKDLQRITKIKYFINKYNWESIIVLSEKDDRKKFEKINVTVALNVLYDKKSWYILLMFQNITEILKSKLFV